MSTDLMRSRTRTTLRFPERIRHRRNRDTLAVLEQTSESVALKSSPISVAIVHHNTLMGEGLTLLLTRQPDMTVAAPSDDPRSVLGQAPADVVLVSLGANGAGSTELSALLSGSGSRFIILAPSADSAYFSLLEHANVHALLFDDATPSELLDTIRSVAEGGRVWPPTTMKALLSRVGTNRPIAQEVDWPADERLTRRERQVMSLIADGLSTKEQARKLGIASFTVRTHVRNIMEKLNLHSRLQIAAHVLRQQRADPERVTA